MTKRGSKAQITLFIIAGIIIMLIAGSIIYITLIREEIEVIPIIKEIPSQAQPVREYVEDCIGFLGEEALEKLGMQGGYINPGDFGIRTSILNPTDSGVGGVQFAPGSSVQLPYWWYLAGKNDCRTECQFGTQQPGLKRGEGTYTGSSIEEQLDKYILENLPGCLDNFAPLTEQGFEIKEIGEIKPLTIITENDVGFYLEYPIDVSRGDSRVRIEQYFNSIPLNIKKIYSLAKEITEVEANNSFLEKNVMNLIFAFSGINSQLLPPPADLTFGSGATIWTENNVKERLKTIMSVYTPALQVFNTYNFERVMFGEDKIKQALYDSFTVPVYNFEGKWDYYSVDFDYFNWWDIYFDAGTRGAIQPENTGIPLIGISFQKYDTPYDISFPTMVTIESPLELKGKGYTFMFALEGNIRNNKPMNTTYGGLIGDMTAQESMMCNYNQKTSGNINVQIKDSVSGKGLNEAAVYYGQGNMACYIGTTNSSGELTEKYPPAYRGIISYEKAGYITKSKIKTIKPEEDKDIGIIELDPIMGKKITIEKITPGATIRIALDRKDLAIIGLTRIKNNQGDADFTITAIIEMNESGEAEVDIAPGQYEGEIRLVKRGPPFPVLYIPARTEETGWGPFKEEITIPAIEMRDTFVYGGAVFDQSTGYLEIGKELMKKDKITFYGLDPGTPTIAEDLGKIADLSISTGQNLNVLQPK